MEGGKDSIPILRNFENSPCIQDGGQNARGLKLSSRIFATFLFFGKPLREICRAAFAVNFLNKRWEGMENMRHFPRFITGIANYLTRLFPIFRRFRYESSYRFSFRSRPSRGNVSFNARVEVRI